MEEAVEELVTALHDCRVLAAGVWQATVAERVASSVVPILSTLSTLLMSLTFQPVESPSYPLLVSCWPLLVSRTLTFPLDWCCMT